MSKAKQALAKIRDLPSEELGQAADTARDELFRLKLASYTNQVQDTASIRNKRRELARIMTVKAGRSAGLEGQAASQGEPVAAPVATKAKAKKSTTKKEG